MKRPQDRANDLGPPLRSSAYDRKYDWTSHTDPIYITHINHVAI